MPNIDRIEGYVEELVAIRHDLHAHPEIGFEEVRTSGIVADLLEGWGITVHRGVGGTGVVGELKGKATATAASDCAPTWMRCRSRKRTGLPYASTIPGKCHACGHDGHTTMLLGAARYLAETRDFAGTAVFVFQPAEEGLGGARAMLQGRLFTRFPCDEIYGLHNAPNRKPGRVCGLSGRGDGRRGLLRLPHQGPWQPRRASPKESRDPDDRRDRDRPGAADRRQPQQPSAHAAVVSVTQIYAGSAYNVIPGRSHAVRNGARLLRRRAALCAKRMKEICAGIAADVSASRVTFDARDIFTRAGESSRADRSVRGQVAREIVGEETHRGRAE